jgi:hypothetical protein
MANILGPDISKGIGQLLHEKRLHVPTYQRSYAWKKQEVWELFQDLRRAIEGDKAYYFLGAIVGCEENENADTAEIVDGQQRLATTTILLAAIRDALIEMGDIEAATRFEGEVLQKTEGFEKPKTEQRLTLSEADEPYFNMRILNRPGPSRPKEPPSRLSNRLIDNAANLARDFIRELTGTRSPVEKKRLFDRWYRFIKDGARVIFILVPDQADAFMVFETLNDRGLELTVADLTKTYLFSMAGKHNIEKVKHSWTSMVSTLATSGESETTKTYIHHLWSSLHGVTREREMFAEIRKQTDSAQKALAFADQLETKADLYAALRNPESDYWKPYGPRFRKHITVLNRLKVSQIRMMLLAAMDHFAQAELETILPCCVWWSVRFSVAGGSPSEIEAHYANRAVEIRQGKITNADELFQSMSPLVPNDAQFGAAFAVESLSARSVPAARYYLQCLQRTENGEQDAHLAEDNEQLGSLEHVLPQNPDHAVWKISEQDAERLTWRLGNLALLHKDENHDRGNGSFDDAKKLYGRCVAFSLTKLIAAYPDWGETEIDARQHTLAGLALRTWPILPPQPPKGKKKKKK